MLLPFFMEDIGMFAKKGICAGLVVVMLAVFGGQTMAQGTLAELVPIEKIDELRLSAKHPIFDKISARFCFVRSG